MKSPSRVTKLNYRPAATQPAATAVARPWPRWLAIAVVAVSLVYFLALAVPFRPAVEESIGYFDYSWMLFLNEAIATGRQSGKEIIYTYGPLGFIATSVFDP